MSSENIKPHRVFCANSKCENNKTGWIPRVPNPKYCPRCKRAIPTEEEKQRKAEALVEVETIDAYTETGFTPGCVICHKDAVMLYKKKFYCLEDGISFLRRDLGDEQRPIREHVEHIT